MSFPVLEKYSEGRSPYLYHWLCAMIHLLLHKGEPSDNVSNIRVTYYGDLRRVLVLLPRVSEDFLIL